MPELEAGVRAPAFSLPAVCAGAHVTAEVPNAAGRPTALMFFQEVGTPVCTAQITSLNREVDLLRELGAEGICVSTDPLERLETFASPPEKLGVTLASDVDGGVARAYGVFDAASKRAQRAVFVIAGDGTILLAIPWYNPANSGQFAAIFEALGTGDSGGGS